MWGTRRVFEADGRYEVVWDGHGEEFGTEPAPLWCPDALYYAGWYSYAHYNDAFAWTTGAIGGTGAIGATGSAATAGASGRAGVSGTAGAATTAGAEGASGLAAVVSLDVSARAMGPRIRPSAKIGGKNLLR